MRKIFPILAVSVIFAVAFIAFISEDSEGKVTIDPYPVPPGVPIPLTLEDFDSKGDILELTIVFKSASSDDFIPRGINILILDSSRSINVRSYEIAEEQSIFVRTNVSTLMSVDVENPNNKDKSIMFFNPQQESDTVPGAWENATVRLRIVYNVNNVPEDEGMNLLPIIMAFAIIIAIILTIVATIMFFRRRSKDANLFFNPEDGPYYAFRSIIEDKVYYLDPEQYAQLYNSTSMDEYDFLGTATRIGGPITSPDSIGMEAITSMPMEGQLMMAVPLEGEQEQVDIASMEAMPVAPSPIEDYPEQGSVEEPLQEVLTQEDLYGEHQQEVPEGSDPSSDTLEQDHKEEVMEEQAPAEEAPSDISTPPPSNDGSSKITEDEPLPGTEPHVEEPAGQE